MNSIEDSPTPSAPAPAAILASTKSDDTFHLSAVVTLGAAHAAHDTYFSYLPTILPLLIQNLSLNTTQAGLLTAASQLPNLLQPAIGHLADRRDLRLLVILAPAISGCLITLVGVAPSFGLAGLLLLLAGISTAGFHAIAPTMTAAQAGRKVGRGMGFFMVGGELGFGVGPLVVVAAISYLTLKGLPWLMILGVLASVILYFRRLNATTVRHPLAQASLPVGQALIQMSGLMLPILGITFITSFLNANLVSYLPTFMSSEGVAFVVAGAALALVGLSGTVGVFLMGLFSDRLGQRNIVLIGILGSTAFSMGFLQLRGWLQLVMLVGVGLTAFIANPAFLALVQTHCRQNRSLASSVYMSSNLLLRSIAVVILGVLADRFGMRAVFIGSTWLTLLALPLVFMLPNS